MVSRSSGANAALAAFFVVCAVAGAYLFYRNVHKVWGRDAPVIGEISFKRQNVSRRFADRLLWQYIAEESPVYSGDFIRTEQGSQTKAKLMSGDIISLDENTVVQIFYSESGGARVELSQGGIGVVSQSGVKVFHGNDELDVPKDGGLSVINLDEGFSVRAATESEMIKMTEERAQMRSRLSEVLPPAEGVGSADAHPANDPSNQIASLTEGEDTMANAEESAKSVPPPPVILERPQGLFPRADAIIDAKYLAQKKTITLSCRAVPRANRYEWSVTQGSFRRGAVTRAPSYNFDEITSLKNDEYTWQVRALRIENGTRTQSAAAVSNFIVAIPPAAAPQIDPPGVLYNE